ncbi:hypothetical protein LM599_02225 [Candidatus Acetothermia bacterium]|nr:hypothetical protein [Candidatus Acetothermia bacterium]MCI2427676.1 hypothetical protein [Candidatus Acetothermia bacterium]MCI2428377.1 hypothetical protein [Candidatus Acetothermia bacterium]
MDSTDAEDINQLKEVLDIVSDRIPALIKGLRNIMYSKEAGKEFGGAVATFYKELIDGGIPAEQAIEMTRGYMINLRDLVNMAKGDISPKGKPSAEKRKKKGFTISIGDKDDDKDEEEENEEEERD